MSYPDRSGEHRVLTTDEIENAIATFERTHPRTYAGQWATLDEAYAIRKAFRRVGFELQILANGQMWARPAADATALDDLRAALQWAKVRGDGHAVPCRPCGLERASFEHFFSAAHHERRKARIMSYVRAMPAESSADRAHRIAETEAA